MVERNHFGEKLASQTVILCFRNPVTEAPQPFLAIENDPNPVSDFACLTLHKTPRLATIGDYQTLKDQCLLRKLSCWVNKVDVVDSRRFVAAACSDGWSVGRSHRKRRNECPGLTIDPGFTSSKPLLSSLSSRRGSFQASSERRRSRSR